MSILVIIGFLCMGCSALIEDVDNSAGALFLTGLAFWFVGGLL